MGVAWLTLDFDTAIGCGLRVGAASGGTMSSSSGLATGALTGGGFS
jgi:hypothetical protein